LISWQDDKSFHLIEGDLGEHFRQDVNWTSNVESDLVGVMEASLSVWVSFIANIQDSEWN